MALMKGKARQTSAVSVESEGSDVYLRAMRDGTLLSADWILAKTIQGRLFCAQAGLLTTEITWTATATNDQTKPAMFIDVPSGTTIFPLEISLYMEAYGSNAQFECEAITGTGGVSAGGTAMTITNMRSDAPYTSNCTGTSDITGGTACTTNLSAFWRDGAQFAITKTGGSATVAATDPNKFVWRYKDGLYCPIVVGHGQLMVTQGSQAGTGFGKIIFIEVPTSEIT